MLHFKVQTKILIEVNIVYWFQKTIEDSVKRNKKPVKPSVFEYSVALAGVGRGRGVLQKFQMFDSKVCISIFFSLQSLCTLGISEKWGVTNLETVMPFD